MELIQVYINQNFKPKKENNIMNTCKVINLKGDPKNPESSEHIITFPGGSISVMRTSDNEYWAHITVNHGQVLDDIPSMSKRGDVVDTRVDHDHPVSPNIVDIPNRETINRIAIRIATK
jgi:hypothetical protein